MDARKFFFAALGVLCLVASYELGATRAEAEWDPNQPGRVIGYLGSMFIDSDGHAYTFRLSEVGAYDRVPMGDLPVAISEVKLLGESHLVTTADEIWRWTGTSFGGWQLWGPLPPATAVESPSFGALKDKFRK